MSPPSDEIIHGDPKDPNELIEEVKADEGLVIFVSRFFIIFGGAIPFVPQYIQIYNTRDASGFSTLVCFVVILSNVLRIAYWFGRDFDISLLIQSIVMTIVMLTLLEICLRVERERAENSGVRFQEYYFFEFDYTRFWQWTTLWSYIHCTLAIFFLSCSYTIFFSDKAALIEPVGFAALLIESSLALPQIVKNYNKKSTEGMNIYMVILWTIGDVLKGIFYFHTGQPLPFKMCASIQVVYDITIFVQVFLYKK